MKLELWGTRTSRTVRTGHDVRLGTGNFSNNCLLRHGWQRMGT
jgi:hypothetical protein